MEVKVRFRFNKVTGEVEEFIVDDVDSRLPEAEHNRQHDLIAREIGRVIERHPGLINVQSSGIEEPRLVGDRAGDAGVTDDQIDDVSEAKRGRIEQKG
jgi:hypothetical protein